MKNKIYKFSYSNQSTATIIEISSVGKPTDVKTSIIVTRPALGTLAAPILAAVAVKLKNESMSYFSIKMVNQNYIVHCVIAGMDIKF